MHYGSVAVSGITLGAIYALIALGFHLIYRTAKVLDFAQGAKAVLGGLIALSLIQARVPLAGVMILVIAVGLGLGFVYELVIIRPSRRNGLVSAIIATVGAELILSNGQEIIWGANGTPFPSIMAGGFKLAGIPVLWQSLWIIVIVIMVVIALTLFLGHSWFGKAMVAAAADPLAASTLGINVTLVRSVAFALAFALAALGGTLIAPFTLAGGGGIGSTLTLNGFTGAVLGGLDSATGAVVGSILFGLVGNMVGAVLPNGLTDPIEFSFLLIVLLFVPNGLFGSNHGRAV